MQFVGDIVECRIDIVEGHGRLPIPCIANKQVGSILRKPRLSQRNDLLREIESIRSYLEASFLRPAQDALQQVAIPATDIQKRASAFDTSGDWPAQGFPVLSAARAMKPEPRRWPGEGSCHVGCCKDLLVLFKPSGEFFVVHALLQMQGGRSVSPFT